MKKHWFKEWGMYYFPISWQGWILTVGALAFCVHIFLFVDQRSDSISDTLYKIFPYVVPTILVLGWIAWKTSD